MRRIVALFSLLGACGGAARQAVTPTTHAAPVTSQPQPALAPPAEPEPAGTLRLEGQVLGAQDVPFAGATVTLSNRSATTKSESDGFFAIDGLPAGTYTVTARAGDGRNGSATVVLTAKSDPVLVRLRAVEEY